jgi:cell division protein FtsB
MSDAKRPDPKRRSSTSRPGKPGEAKGRVRRAQQPPAAPATARREPRPTEARDNSAEISAKPGALVPITQSIADSAEQQSEQRLGSTARRAAILAAVVCVLTLTIAGPVRTYFAQRTEMNQLAATEAALRAQIADLEGQKVKLADPVFIAAQARERLGFVMPGDIPYQVQLPPGAAVPTGPGDQPARAVSNDPWYTALWKTIADAPHGPPPVPAVPPVDPGAPPPADPGAPPPPAEPPPAGPAPGG